MGDGEFPSPFKSIKTRSKVPSYHNKTLNGDTTNTSSRSLNVKKSSDGRTNDLISWIDSLNSRLKYTLKEQKDEMLQLDSRLKEEDLRSMYKKKSFDIDLDKFRADKEQDIISEDGNESTKQSVESEEDSDRLSVADDENNNDEVVEVLSSDDEVDDDDQEELSEQSDDGYNQESLNGNFQHAQYRKPQLIDRNLSHTNWEHMYNQAQSNDLSDSSDYEQHSQKLNAVEAEEDLESDSEVEVEVEGEEDEDEDEEEGEEEEEDDDEEEEEDEEKEEVEEDEDEEKYPSSLASEPEEIINEHLIEDDIISESELIDKKHGHKLVKENEEEHEESELEESDAPNIFKDEAQEISNELGDANDVLVLTEKENEHKSAFIDSEENTLDLETQKVNYVEEKNKTNTTENDEIHDKGNSDSNSDFEERSVVGSKFDISYDERNNNENNENNDTSNAEIYFSGNDNDISLIQKALENAIAQGGEGDSELSFFSPEYSNSAISMEHAEGIDALSKYSDKKPAHNKPLEDNNPSSPFEHKSNDSWSVDETNANYSTALDDDDYYSILSDEKLIDSLGKIDDNTSKDLFHEVTNRPEVIKASTPTKTEEEFYTTAIMADATMTHINDDRVEKESSNPPGDISFSTENDSKLADAPTLECSTSLIDSPHDDESFVSAIEAEKDLISRMTDYNEKSRTDDMDNDKDNMDVDFHQSNSETENSETNSSSDSTQVVPIFKTLKEEDPETTLRQLRHTEQKYNITLSSIADLEEKLGRSSSLPSSRYSSAEPGIENLIIEESEAADSNLGSSPAKGDHSYIITKQAIEQEDDNKEYTEFHSLQSSMLNNSSIGEKIIQEKEETDALNTEIARDNIDPFFTHQTGTSIEIATHQNQEISLEYFSKSDTGPSKYRQFEATDELPESLGNNGVSETVPNFQKILKPELYQITDQTADSSFITSDNKDTYEEENGDVMSKTSFKEATTIVEGDTKDPESKNEHITDTGSTSFNPLETSSDDRQENSTINEEISQDNVENPNQISLTSDSNGDMQPELDILTNESVDHGTKLNVEFSGLENKNLGKDSQHEEEHPDIKVTEEENEYALAQSEEAQPEEQFQLKHEDEESMSGKAFNSVSINEGNKEREKEMTREDVEVVKEEGDSSRKRVRNDEGELSEDHPSKKLKSYWSFLKPLSNISGFVKRNKSTEKAETSERRDTDQELTNLEEDMEDEFVDQEPESKDKTNEVKTSNPGLSESSKGEQITDEIYTTEDSQLVGNTVPRADIVSSIFKTLSTSFFSLRNAYQLEEEQSINGTYDDESETYSNVKEEILEENEEKKLEKTDSQNLSGNRNLNIDAHGVVLESKPSTDSEPKKKERRRKKVLGLDLSEVELEPTKSLRSGHKFGNNVSVNLEKYSPTRTSTPTKRRRKRNNEMDRGQSPSPPQRSNSIDFDKDVIFTKEFSETPASRTRSKSPIKRSAREISPGEGEGEPETNKRRRRKVSEKLSTEQKVGEEKRLRRGRSSRR